MQVFISYQADGLAEDIVANAITDNPEFLKEQARKIALGQRVFMDWASNCGGEVILDGFGMGKISVPPNELTALMEKQSQYEDICQNTVSIGVGNTLSEAEKALFMGQKKGFGEISFFELEQAEAISEEPDFELDDSVLEGSADPHTLEEVTLPSPEDFIEDNALWGIIDGADENWPDPTELIRDQAILNLIPDEDTTPTDDGLSDEEMDAEHESKQQLVQEVLEALNNVNQNMEAIEALKTMNPQMYESILGMVHALVVMAHEIKGVPVEEDEQDSQAEGQPQPEQQEAPEKSSSKPKKLKHMAPAKKAPGRKHVTLPVGAVRNGRVKIKDKDGKVKWVSQRAGSFASEVGGVSSKTTKDWSGGQNNNEGVIGG